MTVASSRAPAAKPGQLSAPAQLPAALSQEPVELWASRLSTIAAGICQVPLAFVALIDPDGVERPVGAHGTTLAALPSLPEICQLAQAANGDVAMGAGDGRGHDVFVDGGPAEFQAALAIRTGDGTSLGSLCVADAQPRALAQEELDALSALGHQAAAEVGLRARLAELERAEGPLRQRAVQQGAAADLGQRALRGLDLPGLMEESVRVVAERLDLSFSQVWELMPDGEHFILRAGVGWPADSVGSLVIPVDIRSQPGFNLLTGQPVFVDDVTQELRFSPPDFVHAQGASSGFSVVIPGPAGSLGVFGGHVREQRTFSEDDASFLQSVANVLGAAMVRTRTEEELHHRATHDPLTGLANRALLVDELGSALRARAGNKKRPAVLFLDVDRFKLVNDSLGHEVGDHVLVALASRLRETLRDVDTLARFGGDEFVVLLDHVAGPGAALRVAKRIAVALEVPLTLTGDQHVVTMSIGVAVAAKRHREPETLLQEADAAMYRAKRSARGSHAVFDASMLAAATKELRIERALRSALANDEFEVVYQPLVSLTDGGIVGMEALLRWSGIELGHIPPSDFIPVAEDSGLIVAIGEHVLREACCQQRAWTQALGGRAPLTVSVNVSGRQLMERDFPGLVESVLRASGLPAAQLSLELTESVLFENGAAPHAKLTALKKLGVGLVLDDFGTGYSSLAYLEHFPLDTIKIDRSFVTGLGSEGHDSAIVDAILAMAQSLGLTVVAEGIEEELQLRHLRARRADVGQGYLFGRPMSAEALWPLLSGEQESASITP